MRSNLAKLRTYQLNESRYWGISGLLSAYKYSTLFELVDGNMYKDLFCNWVLHGCSCVLTANHVIGKSNKILKNSLQISRLTFIAICKWVLFYPLTDRH